MKSDAPATKPPHVFFIVSYSALTFIVLLCLTGLFWPKSVQQNGLDSLIGIPEKGIVRDHGGLSTSIESIRDGTYFVKFAYSDGRGGITNYFALVDELGWHETRFVEFPYPLETGAAYRFKWVDTNLTYHRIPVERP